MTAGETWESCLDDIRALPAVKKYGEDVKVSMYEYNRPSYTDLVYPIECYFPTWVIPKDHDVTKALEEAYHNLYGEERIGAEETLAMRTARPLTDKWTFSTNGVSIMGRNGIPLHRIWTRRTYSAHARTKDLEAGSGNLCSCMQLFQLFTLPVINYFSRSAWPSGAALPSEIL